MPYITDEFGRTHSTYSPKGRDLKESRDTAKQELHATLMEDPAYAKGYEDARFMDQFYGGLCGLMLLILLLSLAFLFGKALETNTKTS